MRVLETVPAKKSSNRGLLDSINSNNMSEKTVLIVDDEAHIRMLIEQTLEDLEDEGVELLFAENGEEALNIIQQERPNLVFLDVMMPKMSGMEVCYKVKKELKVLKASKVLKVGQEIKALKASRVY